MTTAGPDYVPSPKLQALYLELEALNAELIKLGLGDNARLCRLRLFAQSARMGSGEAKLKGVWQNSANTWAASICIGGKQRYLGTFPTPREAHEAYRQAHIEHYGIKSEYHPDYQTNQSLPFDPIEEKPAEKVELLPGVSLTADRTYRARINIGGKMTYLGAYKTPEEAHAAFTAAHIRQHGERSKYFKAAAHA